jgi:hypothetical protein
MSNKNLATQDYVDLKISEIPTPDLSAYAELAGADFTGAITAPNLSGENTGDQDLSGLLKLDQTTPQAVTGGSPVMEGVQFDITPSTTAVAEGLLRWNATDRTLDLGMGDAGVVTQQVGQELFILGVNKTAAPLTEGQAVYINKRQGTRPKFALAKGDADATATAVGVVTENIAVNDEGFCTSFGYVRGIKTNYTGSGNWGTTWVEGDILWVSKTVAGQLTNVEPAAPNHCDIVGSVGIVHANRGSILVNLQKRVTLEELCDVNGTALAADGQFPSWHQTAGYFDFDKNINDYATKASVLNKKAVIDGDLRGLYAVVNYKKIPYTDLGDGITITNILVQASPADPVTELNANIMYCDAQGTGSFPGAGPTLVAAIDTTTGNFDSGAITAAIATGKELYLLLDADPLDLNQTWTITISYTVN